MSNSSGLQTYHDKDGAFENISRDEARKRIFKQKLKFSPGEKYSYSNSGFTVLAMIIEDITGQPFRKFMHDSVFSKAGLSQTGFMGEKIWDRETVVCGTGFSRKGHPYDWPAMSWAELGAGNMVSSVKDYSRWLQALLSGQIISGENVQKLFGEYVKYTDINDEAYYGFGWIILKHPGFGKIVYHNGGEQFGFISTVRLYQQPGSFLIILCNNFDHQPHEMFQLRKEIEMLIFK